MLRLLFLFFFFFFSFVFCFLLGFFSYVDAQLGTVCFVANSEIDYSGSKYSLIPLVCKFSAKQIKFVWSKAECYIISH